LDTGYKDDLDFLLIEDVTLFSYELDYSWMNMVLWVFPFLTCDLRVCYIVDFEDTNRLSFIVVT